MSGLAGLLNSPLAWLLVTLVAWSAASALSHHRGHPSWAAPPLVATVLLIGLLLATRTPYATYMTGGRFVDVLLGPATVALAIPMYRNAGLMRRSARALFPALLAGSVVTAASAMVLVRAFGGPAMLVRSIGAKSVTVPIAMGIAERIGGVPSLTAACVMITALITVPIMGPFLRILGVHDQAARGLAAGTVAHGVATARMLLVSPTAGAFSGLAIGLNAIVSAVLVPILAHWISP